jgi:hypothetical protein
MHHCRRSLLRDFEVKIALRLEQNLSLQDNIFFGAMPSENLHNSLCLLPFEVLPINQLFNSSIHYIIYGLKIIALAYQYS